MHSIRNEMGRTAGPTPGDYKSALKSDPPPQTAVEQGNESSVGAPTGESVSFRQTLTELESAFRVARAEHRMAAVNAHGALGRLAEVMQHKTGQGYKLRALLYSLWNGKPVSLCDNVLGLDWKLRVDLVRVLHGFGFEGDGKSFFYRQMEEKIREAGLWDWFIEEGEAQ